MSVTSIMSHNLEYLKLLKIPVWQVRGQEASEVIEPTLQEEALLVEESIAISSRVIPEVDYHQPQVDVPVVASVDNCTACKLHTGRTQVISGKGSKQSKLVVITEAPTFNEDVAGEPFAEEAGVLFTNILKTIGYSMDDVYITPYVKCSPYQSFITQTEESQCFQHLLTELNEIRPTKILLLGRNVAKYLLKEAKSFDDMRTEVTSLEILGQQIPVYVSYNPYQLLKFPEEKRKVWKDMKKLLE